VTLSRSLLGPGSAGATATAAQLALLTSTVSAILRADAQRRREQFLRDNAAAPTVFIDSVNGSDANDGTTPAKAYATLGKLTSAGAVAGARIGLARGSTFTLAGAFTFPSLTGTPSPVNRTVIGAYGTGAAPVITGNIFNITAAGSAGSYIDVQDLKFTNCGSGYALFIFNALPQFDNRVKRCEFGPHPGTGGIIMGVTGGLIEDCYFHDVWNNVEYPSGIGYAFLLTTGSDTTVARFNTIYNCYKGPGAANTHRDLLFYRNLVIKCRVNGIDIAGGGVVGHAPKIISNFVWHNPTTPNGHGIDTQSSSVGPYWRNNIVVSDYTGAVGNVELYCIDSTSYSSVDVDYNLGYLYPGSTASYGKLGTNLYADLAAFQTALAGTSFAGKEAHSISADPLIANLAWPNGAYVPLAGSPALNAGVAVAPVSDAYLGTAPDLGAYEVA
jgi:hypothetical protein